MTTNNNSGPNPIINSMADVIIINMTHSCSPCDVVMMWCFYKLLTWLAALRVYANWFWWLLIAALSLSLRSHVTPWFAIRFNTKKWKTRNEIVRTLPASSNHVQLQQSRRPKPSKFHLLLLSPGICYKWLSPWPWKHAEVGILSGRYDQQRAASATSVHNQWVSLPREFFSPTRTACSLQ